MELSAIFLYNSQKGGCTMSYDIHELNEDIIFIVDDFYGCIYFVRGPKLSLVIDLGMSREDLKPIIEKYISTPYKVVCTHGHLDHVGRSGEFEYIYMDKRDLTIYEMNHTLGKIDNMYNMKGLELCPINKIKPLPYSFDLGDREVYVVPCPGHTPGSVVFVDPKNKVVFTGDAIGSGCSVWMQVDGALKIKEYHDALKNCYFNLLLLGVNKEWYFLGGHWGHEFHSKVASYNLLDVHILENMIGLTQRIIEGTISYRRIHATQFNTGEPYYANFLKAEMIFTLEQLK